MTAVLETKKAKKTKEGTTTDTKKEPIRVNDVKELVNYCKQHFREPFKGATIDFHPKKPAFVFIPDDVSVTKVDTQKLLDFLKERNVRSILVDALNKKKVPPYLFSYATRDSKSTSCEDLGMSSA
jgi:hypothetical protein